MYSLEARSKRTRGKKIRPKGLAQDSGDSMANPGKVPPHYKSTTQKLKLLTREDKIK